MRTDILSDPWKCLAGAVLEQAVCDLGSHRACEPGDVSHNLCRGGVHSCCPDAERFLWSEWGALLIDETGLDRAMFLRVSAQVMMDE